MTARLARFPPCLLAVAFCIRIGAAARSHELDSASLSLREVPRGQRALPVGSLANSPALQEDLADRRGFSRALVDCRAVISTAGPQAWWVPSNFRGLWEPLTRVLVDIEWLHRSRRLSRVVISRVPRACGSMPARHPGGGRSSPSSIDYTRLGVEHIGDGLRSPAVRDCACAAGSARLRAGDHHHRVHAGPQSEPRRLRCSGLVHVPSPPVEASIALSIVLVCAECLRANPGAQNSGSLATRAPWAVAFAFGLLHGLGFASALLDLGVPEQHVPTALLFFNVGVELGQLGIISAA